MKLLTLTLSDRLVMLWGNWNPIKCMSYSFLKLKKAMPYFIKWLLYIWLPGIIKCLNVNLRFLLTKKSTGMISFHITKIFWINHFNLQDKLLSSCFTLWFWIPILFYNSFIAMLLLIILLFSSHPFDNCHR